MSGNVGRPEPVDGRLALVSGGDRGIGLRIVRLLAERGLRVVWAGREVQHARLAIEALGELADRVAVRELDSADPASVARLVSWMTDRLGRCDVLVNTIAVQVTDDRVVEADLAGTWRLTRSVVPLMRAHRYGRIVNVLCVAEGWLRPPRRLPAYEISASELTALTGQLAADLAADGILVNAYWADAAIQPAAANARLHPAAPADAVVWLATLPDSGPTGVVHRERLPGSLR